MMEIINNHVSKWWESSIIHDPFCLIRVSFNKKTVSFDYCVLLGQFSWIVKGLSTEPSSVSLFFSIGPAWTSEEFITNLTFREKSYLCDLFHSCLHLCCHPLCFRPGQQIFQLDYLYCHHSGQLCYSDQQIFQLAIPLVV